VLYENNEIKIMLIQQSKEYQYIVFIYQNYGYCTEAGSPISRELHGRGNP